MSVTCLQNWVVEFDKWLPDKEKEERKKNGGGSISKPSKSRNKRAQQNGRLSKTPAELLQPPNNVPHAQLSGGLSSVVTNNAVSMPTIAMETGGNSPLFPNVLSESDQQLLRSITSNNITSHLPPTLPPQEKYTTGGLPQGNTAIFSSASAPESRPHTPNPSVADSRSHTASPSTPDVQYRTFKLFVLSDGVRNMETRLRLIKQWRSEGVCVCVCVCVCASACVTVWSDAWPPTKRSRFKPHQSPLENDKLLRHPIHKIYMYMYMYSCMPKEAGG